MIKRHFSWVFAALVLTLSACSAEAEMIAKVETSGLFVKDTLEVHAFNDPTIQGITCYVTMPKRAMSFEDQTNSSISCRQVGAISGPMTNAASVFSARKGGWFKAFRVDRFYDKARNVMVYLAYTTKLSGDNASHSISVVPLN